MKTTRLHLVSIMLMLLVSACSAQVTPAPTVDVASVQGTAVVIALTAIAQTQQAIPTATPLPPTDTPIPTLPPPTDIPTLAVPATLAAPTSASSSSGNSNSGLCGTLPSSPTGRPTTIKLVNQANAPIVVSLYLNLTPFGECGFRGYNMSKASAITLTDLPQGCYNASVIINDPKKPAKSFGYGCINTVGPWLITVTTGTVTFALP